MFTYFFNYSRMYFFRYIISFGMVCIATIGLAQQKKLGKPIVENYSSYEYKAGLQNWAVVQDNRDIVYIGNRFGVLEYDGARWNLIQLEKKTIGRSLALGENGKIYVGGQGEFGYLEPDSVGQYQYVPLWQDLPEEYQNFEDVWRIYLLPDGIAFSTIRALFIYSEEGFTVIEPTDKNHLFERAYYCNGRLFIQEMNKGLLEWKQGQLELVPGGERFSDAQIKEILPFEGEKLLVLTFSEGMFSFSENSIIPWSVPANQFVRENFIYSAIHLEDGNYAVGTADRGLVHFDSLGNILQTLDRFDGLQNNTVLSLFQDSESNLWLGLDNGLSYVEINSPFSQISGNVAFQGTPYTSNIWEDQLFLGTTNGVFYSNWNRVLDPLEHPEFKLLENTQGQAYQLMEVGGELLLAHHTGAFAIRGKKAVPISQTEGAWTFMELQDKPGFMIGGTYTGLELFKKEAEGWRFVRHFPAFLESSRMMEQDSLGYIWITHGNKGVFRIKLSEDLTQIEEVRHYNAKNGFPSNIFINVHDVMGQLVFSAEQGCYLYHAKSDSFVPHDRLNEIFGKETYVRELVEDEWGHVWYQAGEEFGMLKIVDSGFQKQVDRVSIDKLKGKLLAGYEHIWPYAKDGVIVGTQEGFLHYDPTYYSNNKLSFRTTIRSLEILSRPDNKVFGGVFQAGDSILIGQEEGHIFEIPAQNNSFRIRFAAPFFEDVDKMQFSYRLVGFEDNWSDWSPAAEKEYTNIPEGSYSFEVKAMNIYQQESEPGIVQLSILQPWFKSKWAILAYGITLSICISLVFFQNNRRLEKEKSQIMKEQEKTLKMREEAYNEQSAKSEEEIMRLKNEKLHSEIAFKTRELTSSAIHLVQKGEILRKIKLELEKLTSDVSASEREKLNKLIKAIDNDLKLDKNWEKFEYHFDSVHENFLRRLRERFPELSPKDQKLCAYLRMNLSTKEIAPLMNISIRGVEISRYRLRKKMKLEAGTNLVGLLLQIN